MVDKAVFCIDCVHYKENPLGGEPQCMAQYPACFDLVTGRRNITPPCRDCRSATTRCGTAGSYFEPKRKSPETRHTAPAPTSKVKVIAGRGDREVK